MAAETAAGTDERWRARIAGVALIASPILWFVGAVAFMSRVGGFYGDDDPVTKVNAIAGQQVAWTAQSVVFFAGTVAALVGLAFLASLLWRTRAAVLARAGVVGLVTVAGLSALSFFLRVTAPLDGVRTEADVPALLIAAHHGWLGVLDTSLTLVTIAIYGAALFWSGRAKLTGAAVVALGGLILAAVLTVPDPPPPVIVYPIAAILGVRLLFWGAPATR